MHHDPRQSSEGSHPQPLDSRATSANRTHQLQGGGDRDPELYADQPPAISHTRRTSRDRFPTHPPPCDDPYYCDSDHDGLYHDMLTSHQRNGILGPAQLRALFRREVERGHDDELRKTLLDNGPIMVHYGWITEAFLGEMGGSMLSGDEEDEEGDGGSGSDYSDSAYTASSGFYGRRERVRGGEGLGYGEREFREGRGSGG